MLQDQVRGFSVSNWSAWAPGIQTRDEWLQWAAQGQLPAGDSVPAVASMPAMQRRRLLRLGKMALENLYALAHAQACEMPVVFASRNGETHRSLQLLRELHVQSGVSPQSFSLSVHNAIAGLFTIANGWHSNVIAVSGGRQTAQAGLAEALALLADGAECVLLLVCDEPLPEIFQPYADEAQCAYAYGLLLKNGSDFCLGAAEHTDYARNLPEALSFLRFILDPAQPAWCPRGTAPAWGLVRKH